MSLVWVFGAPIVMAREVRQGDQCRLAADEIIEGDLFVLCRTLEISGQIRGNLIGAATTAIIDGSVEGGLYLAAGQLTVSGRIGENTHFLGPALRVTSDALLESEQSDILSVSLSTWIEQGARIPDDVIGVGYQLIIDGEVGSGVNFWGSALTVAGRVQGSIDANVGDVEAAGVSELQALLRFLPVDVSLERPGLRVDPGARIDGQLRYTAPSEGVIDAPLTFAPEFTQVFIQPDITQIAAIAETADAGRQIGLYASQTLREFLTLMLIGIVLIFVAPTALPAPLRSLTSRPLPSLGLGLLTFVVSFPAFVILVLLSILLVFALGLFQLADLSIIGALLLGAFNFALGSGFYFAAIFVSRVIVCLGFGRLLLRAARPGWNGRNNSYIQLFIGTLSLSLFFALPAVGWLVSALAAFWGLGAILTYFQTNLEARRRSTISRSGAMPMLPSHSIEARQYPPPMVDTNSSPGMTNLPDGFRWWDEE